MFRKFIGPVSGLIALLAPLDLSAQEELSEELRRLSGLAQTGLFDRAPRWRCAVAARQLCEAGKCRSDLPPAVWFELDASRLQSVRRSWVRSPSGCRAALRDFLDHRAEGFFGD